MTESTDLAEVAQAGLGDVAGESHQDSLEGTNFVKMKFARMGYDAPEGTEFKIGDEVSFTVRARVFEVGDKQMADGHVQKYVGANVTGVVESTE